MQSCNRQQIRNEPLRNGEELQICNCPQMSQGTLDVGCACCRSGHEHPQCPRSWDFLALANALLTPTPQVRRSRGKRRGSVPRWKRG